LAAAPVGNAAPKIDYAPTVDADAHACSEFAPLAEIALEFVFDD
jgi:hypothetical protein